MSGAPGTAPAQPRVINHGCRLNIAEGERIRTLLSRDGGPAPTIINSCGVTSEAVASARRAIRREHRERPDQPIFVTGCAAQIAPQTFAAMPQVAGVVGNAEKFDADSYRAVEPGEQRIEVGDIMALTRSAPQLLPAFDQYARAFLEVQNGCDHRCTFCVIPYGRGPSRSVDIDTIIDTAARLTDRGHREIVLTGVDLTSFGQCAGADHPDTPTLATLCQRLLSDVAGLERLRLGSIDVAEIDDALFDLLTAEPRMMPHVHLSLQSGDDMILKRMKRRHSRAQAVAMVERLKAARPDIAIGADLIAGFPTEDDAAAANSAAIITDCDIVFAHIFPYSPREGTPAARMPQTDRAVVKQRAAALRTVAQAHQLRWLSSLIGTRQQLLVERDGHSGHIDNFARMRITTGTSPGSVVQVRVTGLDGAVLIGEMDA